MLLKKFIHSILILTLIIQLFPTNSKGRFVVQNKCKEDNTELPDAKSSPLRQLIEEDHKDIMVEHDWVRVHFIQINNLIFHFSEELPVPHFGPIHTPPPNYFA